MSRKVTHLALALVALWPVAALAQSTSTPEISGPYSSRALGVGVSEPVRDLIAREALRPAEPQLAAEAREINKLNTVVVRPLQPSGGSTTDGALQSSAAERGEAVTVTPLPTATCEGIANADNPSGVNPPDTTGDVGPNHYVQGVNNRVQIFNKSCVSLGVPFSMSNLFSSIGGICSAFNQGDPIILYDRLADRWMITQFAFGSQTAPPWHECIAISQTGDPLGAYFAYDFVVPPLPLPPGGGFPDYPKLGVWPSGYYMTTREFNPGFVGHGAFAFERAKMLLGDPTASLIYFHVASSVSLGSSGMVPSDHDGILPPPAGAPNMFAIFTDEIFGDPADTIRLFDFTPNYVTPASSTFTERGDSPLAVASFGSPSPSGRGDIPQPAPAVNPTDNVDAIGDRLMPKLAYINRGGTESWVVGHTVNAGVVPPASLPTVAQYVPAPRWYELRRTTFPGAVTVNDQGTFSPTTLERWMPSVAMNNQGDIAVGYSTSSSTAGDEPSIAWAARQIGDPAGTLQTEAEMFASTGVQFASGNRWGDYTAMSVDPADDCTFWHTNEWFQTPNAPAFSNWRTRIGNFVFPGCVSPQKGTISGTVTAADTAAALGGVLVELSGAGPSAGFSDTTDASGNYAMEVAPGTYTVTFRNPIKACTPDIVVPGVSVANGGTTDQDAVIDGNPVLVKTTHAVTQGNGNGIVNRDECNNLSIRVQNNGCGNATALSGTLSTTTPGVTVNAPTNSAYPDLPIGQNDVNTVAYQIATSAAFVCGTPIDLSLNIGSGPVNFSIPSCGGGAPVQFNGAIDAADAAWTFSGRVSRSGTASQCFAVKSYPGNVAGGGGRRFETQTVTNTFTQPVCLTATLSTTCTFATNGIFATTYLGAFDPANLATNYLADGGLSPNQLAAATPITWSFNLPASATATFVINETVAGTGCASYTLDVTGFFDNTAGPGATTCTTTPVQLMDFEVGKKR